MNNAGFMNRVHCLCVGGVDGVCLVYISACSGGGTGRVVAVHVLCTSQHVYLLHTFYTTFTFHTTPKHHPKTPPQNITPKHPSTHHPIDTHTHPHIPAASVANTSV